MSRHDGRPIDVRAGCFGTELIPARLSSHAAWDTTAPSRNSVSWRPDMGNSRSRSAVPPIGLSMIVSTPISPGAISCASLARQSSTVLVRYDIAVALKPAITVEIGRAHVCTPVTNAHLVCRLLLDKKHITNHKTIIQNSM